MHEMGIWKAGQSQAMRVGRSSKADPRLAVLFPGTPPLRLARVALITSLCRIREVAERASGSVPLNLPRTIALEAEMEIVAERVCGIDVHKAEVTVCVLTGRAGQKSTKQIRRFSTFTPDLVTLGNWLKANGVTHVAAEREIKFLYVLDRITIVSCTQQEVGQSQRSVFSQDLD